MIFNMEYFHIFLTNLYCNIHYKESLTPVDFRSRCILLMKCKTPWKIEYCEQTSTYLGQS